VFRTAIKEQGMLVDILKLLKSPDIEMMNNAATVTFNVSVYYFYESVDQVYAFYETVTMYSVPRTLRAGK